MVYGGDLRRSPHQAGFTLLGLLFLVTVLGLLLAAVGTTWSMRSQREKEAELLFIGDQYRRALASYYRLGPSPDKHYPKKLSDLTRDPRFPSTVRHLRRQWPDPITGGDWALLRDEEGGIKGVHSPSSATPIKDTGFSRENAAFEGSRQYADWQFVAGAPQ
ncbi:MAG: type II secretion system protein [Gallionellaceae bacterium]|nr:type II secretion system protein [Gallionellaceae bacterium]